MKNAVLTLPIRCRLKAAQPAQELLRPRASPASAGTGGAERLDFLIVQASGFSP